MPHLVEVGPLPDYRLFLRYSDGTEGKVDLSHLVGRGVFKAWEDLKVFNSVRIGEGGQVEWDDEIDLCADSLYMELTGKKPEEVFPALSGSVSHA